MTVISSALDSIGQPAYGPEIVAGSGTWQEIREVIGALPDVLRDVWLAASVAPADGTGLFAVDRRMLSVETKRALERMPGLRFRQGLVTSVAMPGEGEDGRPGRAVIETAFGEAIEGDAVVIAVGMALGGRVCVGEDAVPGGRYGETPSDGLRGVLERMGAAFEEVRLRVGPRFSRAVVGLYPGEGRAQGEVRVGEETGGEGPVRAESGGEVLRSERSGCELVPSEEPGDDAVESLRVTEGVALEKALGWAIDAIGMPDDAAHGRRGSRQRIYWPAEFPAAPNWTGGLRLNEMVLAPREGGGDTPVLLPDGLATGEVWVDYAGPVGEAEYPPASRLEHTVVGERVGNLTNGGRLNPGAGRGAPLWVTGRAAGAETYLESLAAGARVAEEVVAVLCKGAARGDGEAAWEVGESSGCATAGGDPGLSEVGEREACDEEPPASAGREGEDGGDEG